MPKDRGPEWAHVHPMEPEEKDESETNDIEIMSDEETDATESDNTDAGPSSEPPAPAVTVRCIYCSHVYANLAVRIRAHLSCTPRFGIQPCPSVPSDVTLFFLKIVQTKKEDERVRHAKEKIHMVTSSKPLNVLKQTTLLNLPSRAKKDLVDRYIFFQAEQLVPFSFLF